MTTGPLATTSGLGLRPMRPRDPEESGRAASTLELFFDLVFVVAVSIAAVNLHHALTLDHVRDGVAGYAVAIFAIWWAWMNFTWFATSFDTDDWLYRLMTFVQMAGVLVLAAGLEPWFTDHDPTIMVFSYVLMRVAMVAQWLRASRGEPKLRATTRTYAGGIAILQCVWLAALLVPHELRGVVIVVLILAEVAIPVIAERHGTTPWHAHHITERYGLFTLILLGESLLASANAIIEAYQEHEALGPLVRVAVLTFVVTCGLWWIYFWSPHHHAIGTLRRSLRYGYFHYLVFAAAGAFSAGIEVQIDSLTHHSELGEVAAAFAVAIPVAVFILGVWWIAMREVADRTVNLVVPMGALVILLDPVLPVSVAVTALAVIAIVVVLVRHPPVAPPAGGAAEGAEGSVGH